MTTVLEPERHQTHASKHRRPTFDKKSLPARYSGQMLYFMGAALIAGAVVHYPIDPSLYAIICAVGAVVFLLGTIVNEFVLADERPAVSQAFSLVAFSLLLSFGVGMVGGGIQHFEQFPERSAWMTPIGLLMSYVAFVAKDSKGRWRHLVSPFAAVVVVISALTWLGMISLAGTISSGGHDHGSTTQTPAEPDQTPAEQDQAPAEQDHPAEAPAKPAEDGHTSHSH
ncbi:DUF3784 domain-containing protein [Streptomyces sp. PKU-EA00015]|uniref:DUF3784 domain-containing protein n=1 Tax=Streptomyces sp. PKU-EA00015 TaxID=2748326 RepID=UPI0015A17BBA|nr:DUF3784 domain-containing protein [Streptomyces sp. PKU-EA00015]NWF24701.1 DUF3784 domain-containing protein [Streptomyces sp. PKU-EA00015]